MKVLSLPGRNFRGNSYFKLFCDGLEKVGIDVIDIRSKDVLYLKFDIIHIHFPEHYVTEQNLIGAIKWTSIYSFLFLISKLFNKKIVRTIHDVLPFKQRHKWLLKPYMTFITYITDSYVFMTDSSINEFFEYFPNERQKPSVVIEHGPYPVRTINQAEIDVLRSELLGQTTDAFLVGFLGNIKEYKGIEALNLFPEKLMNGRPIKLVIAGKCDTETQLLCDEVMAKIRPEKMFRIDEVISDELLDKLIRSVDVVFLPYKKGWNSGLGILVLCNEGRILASSLPVFADVRKKYGEIWTYQYNDANELSKVLNEIESKTPVQNEKDELKRKLALTSFELGASKLKNFYESL
jgi:beta-1,4-mannosyltransferase